MEKLLWVVSAYYPKNKQGLDEVNEYLSQGWTVKHISAANMGDSAVGGQAYVVIEKKD